VPLTPVHSSLMSSSLPPCLRNPLPLNAPFSGLSPPTNQKHSTANRMRLPSYYMQPTSTLHHQLTIRQSVPRKVNILACTRETTAGQRNLHYHLNPKNRQYSLTIPTSLPLLPNSDSRNSSQVLHTASSVHKRRTTQTLQTRSSTTSVSS
jgi:hypothetical protein